MPQYLCYKEKKGADTTTTTISGLANQAFNFFSVIVA